jgi:hypothetical protein
MATQLTRRQHDDEAYHRTRDEWLAARVELLKEEKE